jgi:hypothetical protein
VQANPYRVQNSLHPWRWDERGASRHLRRVGGSEYLSGATTYRVPASVPGDKCAGFGRPSSWFYSRSWI